MKGYVALIVIVVITAISTTLFYNKYKNDNPLYDQLNNGLSHVKELTPLSTTIYYDSLQFDDRVFAVARYALSPRNLIVAKPDIIVDTLLSISKDSLSVSHHNAREVLTSYHEGDFYYTLSTSNE